MNEILNIREKEYRQCPTAAPTLDDDDGDAQRQSELIYIFIYFLYKRTGRIISHTHEAR